MSTRTENSKKTKNGILEGVIWKQLLLFFFPIMIGSFFQQLYNTADALILGREVGKEALAAVGGSAALISGLVVNFFMGLTSGAGIVASPALLKMMNTAPELMKDSITYLQIYFLGSFFIFIYNTGSSILRALGDSKRPLYYLIVCCIINIILDILMVSVFEMGVAGVAIATVAAQAVSAILVTQALMREKELCQFSLKKIRLHGELLKSELFLGFPSGIQASMYNISNMLVQSSINSFGTDTTAAWAAYGKLDAIFWMMSGALGIAITTFVGQNYGAGKMDRVKKSIKVCLGMDIGISILMTVLLIVGRVPLFRIFCEDANVVEIGARMLYVIAPFYVAYIFTEIFSGALRGMGDVVVPMLITTVGVCFVRVCWILIVAGIYPVMEVVIFNYPVTWILSGLLFIFYYNYRIKKIESIFKKRGLSHE